MSDQTTELMYDYKDLAELMIRDQGLNEGHWMVTLKLSHAGLTMETPDGVAAPAIINRVTAIGLSRQDEPNLLTVDAAEIASKA